MRDLPHPSHLPKPRLGPLTLAVLGLTLAGGALKSAHAGSYTFTKEEALREVKAQQHLTLANSVQTIQPGSTQSPYSSSEATVMAEWNGPGQATVMEIKQPLTVTTTPISLSASAGVTASAGANVRIGCFDPNTGAAFPGNPVLPNPSDQITGPGNSGPPGGGVPTTDPNASITATCYPQSQYGRYFVAVKFRISAYSSVGLSQTGASGSANAGLQQITPGTRSIIYRLP